MKCSYQGCNKRVKLRGKCYEHSNSGNAAVDLPETTKGEKSAERFRRATIKPAETNISPNDDKATKRPKSVSVAESTAVKTELDSIKPAKRARRATIKTEPATMELEKMTMVLRSGQRIKRIACVSSAGQGDLESEGDALPMH